MSEVMIEFYVNPEPRCPVILLLDTSSSMIGKPIQELNQGILEFKKDMANDRTASLRVEIAIVTFGPVRLLQDFVTVDQFEPQVLDVSGMSPLGEALDYSLQLLKDRKTIYKECGIKYFQPWVFLITDGAPTDSWEAAAERIKQAQEEGKLSFFAVAIKGADIDVLKHISHPTRPPLTLEGLRFADLFLWVSQSVAKVSKSYLGDKVQLPPIGWADVS